MFAAVSDEGTKPTPLVLNSHCFELSFIWKINSFGPKIASGNRQGRNKALVGFGSKKCNEIHPQHDLYQEQKHVSTPPAVC